MKKWKYKALNIGLSEKELNNLGGLGWELVSHTAITDGVKAIQYYVFKQEINDTITAEKPD